MAIRPHREFGAIIARAGVKRSELAQKAGVSKRTLDRLSQPKGYGDGGTVLPVSAWRIARAFSKLADTTDEAAFNTLFIEENDQPSSHS